MLKVFQTTSSVKFFLPIFYAVLIILYPYPSNFDINHYVRHYEHFARISDFQTYWEYLWLTPDVFIKVGVSLFAFVGWPLECFLFIITYSTVWLALHAYEKLYFIKNNTTPKAVYYLIIFLILSVSGILSGVRNMHAWVCILYGSILYFESTHQKKYGILLFIYGCLVHYASYILLPVLFFKNKKYKYVSTVALLISALLYQFVAYNPHWISFISIESVRLKIDFYLSESNFLTSFLTEGNVMLFAFVVFKLYVIFLYSFYLLKSRKTFIDNIPLHYFAFVSICFLFFPDVFNRYTLLFNMLIIFYILTNKELMQSIQTRFFVMLYLFFSVIEQYFFWKQVYYTSLFI